MGLNSRSWETKATKDEGLFKQVHKCIEVLPNGTVLVSVTEAPTMGLWGKPFENRETLELELFLTRHWTHADPAEKWTADAYRYAIAF